MPKRVMNPTSEAIEITPSVKKMLMMPPISARGRFTITSAACLKLPNSKYSTRRMAIIDMMLSSATVRVACSSLSNWPPYCT